MITKQQLLNIWCTYYKKDMPKKYKPLFTEDGFMRFIEGTFLTKEEQETLIKYTHCLYCSCVLERKYDTDEWTEDLWMKMLNRFVQHRVSDMQNKYYYDDVIEGIICILELSIPHIEPEQYSRFYNGTDYGYFGLPRIIDIATYIKFDISKYLETYNGFTEESTVPKFDMKTWQNVFKKSKQITMLKDAVCNNGKVLDFKDMPRYNYGDIDHWKTAEMFYPYAQYITKIHKVVGHYIPLRKVNTGSGYIEELVDDYGWLVGFHNETPIYKINTVQGFAFYICGSDWGGGVYCDDITIKKIKFGNPKPENKDLDSDKRIFVIYNESTGYWQLPELYYPIKYKQYIQDVLKKQKSTIGNWGETIVYAHSRTLNGNSYRYNTEHYPDIKNKSEFIEKIAQTAADNAINSLHLSNKFKSLGLRIKVEFENDFDFDFDSVVKPLNCITQEDINNYISPKKSDDIFTIEKYNIQVN